MIQARRCTLWLALFKAVVMLKTDRNINPTKFRVNLASSMVYFQVSLICSSSQFENSRATG